MNYEFTPNCEERLDEIAGMVAAFREIGEATADDDPAARAMILLSRIHAIGEASTALAVDIAAQGIAAGHISRRAAADRLGVHHNTLGRWIINRVQLGQDNVEE